MQLARLSTRLVPVVLFAGVALLSIPADGNAGQKKKPDKFPEFKDVEAAVHKQLRSNRAYRPMDILSRSDVNGVMKALEGIGWKVAERKAIVAATLPDGDYLVRQLRSTKLGVTFMRKVSHTPEAYDRLDRLRKLPYGPRRIPELMSNPGGYTLILYMTQTPGGKNLGRYLSQTPSGRNFNKPTRRIYEEKHLLGALRESYDLELKRRRRQRR